MSLVHRLLLLCLLLLPASVAIAQPLRADHPLIGTWKITAPGGCSETYVVRGDGTAAVTSAEEVAESELAISEQPSAKGFFKWVEKIVKDNGKKDCSGDITDIGRVVTSYVLLDPSKDLFAMCEREDRNTCIGPFKRVK
jgi:hypothetical protein